MTITNNNDNHQEEEEIVIDAENQNTANTNNSNDPEITVTTSTDNQRKRRFPDPFYDPNTGKIMKKPVVNIDGDSYDNTNRNEDANLYYPNRALQSIIEQQIKLSQNNIIGSVRRLDYKLRRGWSRLVDPTAFPGQKYKPLPESYYCPITCDIIVDPVITPDGITYERNAIVNWINVNGTSPITRNSLSVEQLRSNNNLYSLIQKEKEKTLEHIHPSIRRWKESGVPTTRPDGINNVPTPSAPDEQEIVYNNNNNYPTSIEEIQQNQQQQQSDDRKFDICVCFCIICILLFVPYAFVGFAICIAIFFLEACCGGCSAPDDEDE